MWGGNKFGRNAPVPAKWAKVTPALPSPNFVRSPTIREICAAPQNKVPKNSWGSWQDIVSLYLTETLKKGFKKGNVTQIQNMMCESVVVTTGPVPEKEKKCLSFMGLRLSQGNGEQ